MLLNKSQFDQYHENGFVIIPNLFSRTEVDLMCHDLDRLGRMKTDHVVREKTGVTRTIFRTHDADSPTFSQPFHRASRAPRILDAMRQIIGDKNLYIYHSKLNLKDAIDGEIWQWHQDYGYWIKDGTPSNNLSTCCVLLGESSELSGCLYFIPGSHKRGLIEPVFDDTTTSYGLWRIPRSEMIRLIEELGDPVPITGPPGTAIMFHPEILHCSGHNMGARPRWQIYFVYNSMSNKPRSIQSPRPEYVCSRKCELLGDISKAESSVYGK